MAQPMLPWWVSALVSLCAVLALEYRAFDVAREMYASGDSYEQVADRRLAQTEATGEEKLEANLRELDGEARSLAQKDIEGQIKDIKGELAKKVDKPTGPPPKPKELDLPLTVPCAGPFIKPCGKIIIGPAGQNITTPFGTKHIPGTALLETDAKGLTKSFSHYTVYFVAGGVGLYILATICITSRREAVIQGCKDIISGKIEEDDADVSPEDKAQELKDKLDPKSEDFIAPGNVYRLQAVLHPGKIGWMKFLQRSFKAGICGYMQMFIPFKIIKGFFIDWDFNGIKTPLWFIGNIATFASMFAALGALCNLFAAKCGDNIRIGAEANYYIMSHHEPEEGHAAAASPEAGGEYAAVPGADAEAAAAAPAPMIPHPKMSPGFIHYNQYFWCTFSMTMNVSMSMMLFLILFLRVATFHGKMDDVALVAVSLYFVFDLDKKVMESDPKLRPRYREAVLHQTCECEENLRPVWMLVMACTMKKLMEFATPIGLMGIILISWRSDILNKTIGGDPF